jgi:hypothetical protein
VEVVLVGVVRLPVLAGNTASRHVDCPIIILPAAEFVTVSRGFDLVFEKKNISINNFLTNKWTFLFPMLVFFCFLGFFFGLFVLFVSDFAFVLLFVFWGWCLFWFVLCFVCVFNINFSS